MSNSLLLYLFTEIISIALFYFSIKLKRKNKTASRVLFAASIIPILFLICFRAQTVGTDVNVYKWAYSLTAKNNNYARDWLGGFFYVFRMLSALNSYMLVLAIINSITIVVLYISAYKSPKMPTLSLIVIMAFCLHLQSLNQFRQSLAVALCLLNIHNAKKQNLKAFSLVQFAAIIAHTTSIIFIPVYLLAKKRFKRKTVVLYSILGLLMIPLSSVLIKMASSTSYGQRYLGGQYDYAADSSMIVLAIRITLFILSYVLGSEIRHAKNVAVLYHMAAICAILQIITTKSFIFARLTTYYYVAYVFLIPEVIASLRLSKKGRLIVIVGVIIALLMYKIVYYQKMGPGAGIDNYKFIWNL